MSFKRCKCLIFLITFALLISGCTRDNAGLNQFDFSEPPTRPLSFNDVSASELISGIKVGWNLGNSFDARYLGTPDMATVYMLESHWGNTPTTKANIDAIKTAGFNAFRIPVTWHKVVDEDYNIRADWMERITEVVNYASLNDMYIILNTHHDEYSFSLAADKMAQSEKNFAKVWKQIADNFKNYDEKLMFESFSAPRAPGSPNEWNGGSAEERANLNSLNQLFVDTVRATGANNTKRVLIITTHGSSTSHDAMSALTMPEDSAEEKIVVSIHGYIPHTFTHNPGGGWASTWSRMWEVDTEGIDAALENAYNIFVSKGIPVLITEMGAQHRNNPEARAEWAEYFVSSAKEIGIPCFWWDNGAVRVSSVTTEGFGLLNRSTNEIVFPEVVEALLRGSES